MTSPNADALDEFFEKLARADRQRKQAKLTKMEINETSGVSRPGHLVEGWVVLKSAEAGHDHRTDVAYLEGPALEASLLWGTGDLLPGHELSLAKDRSLGKSLCGCVYTRTPETADKAASDAWLASRQEAVTKETGGWTPEEIAYLMGETKPTQP